MQGESSRVLYICYLSLEDPLVHTQVVAYLEGLADRGHTIHLLTYDGPLTRAQRRSIEQDLCDRGISWHSLRYHKRPSLPATAFDALRGAIEAARLVRRHDLDLIHARNHVPAFTALLVQSLTGCRLLFDVRGLMAEEYVDAGRWKRGGLAYRMTNWVQRAALRRADGVAMLTEAVRPYLASGNHGKAVAVIPCCADVEQIESRLAEREAVRTELRVADRGVMVYVGKCTGWYMEREMAEFYEVARRSRPGLVFLIVTQADATPIVRELRRLGIGSEDYRVLRAEPGDLGRYLAVADYGISFIRPSFSKISSSPTKVGEYLSAGLPVVSSAGIGDVNRLLGDNRVGVLVEDFSPSSYQVAVQRLARLQDDAGVHERCRDVARAQLSVHEVGIPRYDALYRQLANEAEPRPTERRRTRTRAKAK